MIWDGNTITKPGAYDRLPLNKYHRHDICDGPSASSSMLRTIFNRSPAHMYCAWTGNPDCVPQADKQAWTLGRAAHHLLLGEADYLSDFAVRPEQWDSWRTKESQQWRAHQQNIGRTVLTPEDEKKIRGMARSLKVHPVVGAGILSGTIEQSLVYQDKKTGIWLKSRPDALPDDSADFADLKTTTAVGFELDRSVMTWRYDMQAALTKWAAEVVLGIKMTSFSFVFVESEPPYCVDVLELKEETIVAAEEDLRTAIDVFSYCLQTGNWFGPSGSQFDARPVYPEEWQRERNLKRRAILNHEIRMSSIRASEDAA